MRPIWIWITHNATTDHVALVVSVLAFMVAFWAGYQAKRGATAAEKQAQIASEQLSQSLNASYSAQTTAKEAKAVAWHDVNTNLMERAARVVVGVEEIQIPPVLLGASFQGDDYPKTVSIDQPKSVNSRRDRHRELYYWVRGVILNEDTEYYAAYTA